MRLTTLILSAIFICSCNSSKSSKAKQSELNGTWIPTRQELSGKALPAAVYGKQTLIIDNNNYTLIAESVDKGELKFDKGKMDIYGKEGVNAGKHFTAIYKLQNGELTICYDLSGKNYPAAFETSGSPTLFLSAFKRQEKR